MTERGFARLFRCTRTRIIRAGDTLFLILGNKKRSEGEWFKSTPSGLEPMNFDYIEEQVVASGLTLSALEKSAKAYKQLLKESQ